MYAKYFEVKTIINIRKEWNNTKNNYYSQYTLHTYNSIGLHHRHVMYAKSTVAAISPLLTLKMYLEP